MTEQPTDLLDQLHAHLAEVRELARQRLFDLRFREEGRRAFFADMLDYECPYIEQSSEGEDWIAGWRDAEANFGARNE